MFFTIQLVGGPHLAKGMVDSMRILNNGNYFKWRLRKNGQIIWVAYWVPTITIHRVWRMWMANDYENRILYRIIFKGCEIMMTSWIHFGWLWIFHVWFLDFCVILDTLCSFLLSTSSIPKPKQINKLFSIILGKTWKTTAYEIILRGGWVPEHLSNYFIHQQKPINNKE